MPASDMSQEEEPSIIAYARFYGLVRNHLEFHPLQGIAAGDSLSAMEPQSSPPLSEIDFAKFEIPEERLTVDAGAATLLSAIVSLANEAPSRADTGIETRRIQRMKYELPLLRSDHELDMFSFAPQVVPDLEHEFLPLETIDEEADEGLTWPSKCYDLPDEYAKKSESEKLQVSSGAIAFLKAALAFHLEGDIHEDFEHDYLYCRKSIKVEPLSPPLLPLSPSLQPFIPSSETGHLDLLSDKTSPTRQELDDVERMLFKGETTVLPKKQADDGSQCSDQMLLDSGSLGDIFSPLRGIKHPPSSPSAPRAPLKDRKVEVPLSPAASERLPLWRRKSVTFSEALPELIPDLPSPIPKPNNTSSSEFERGFEDAIASIGVKAEREIDQEQLQEDDTMLRVTVPVMDFSLPIAPWKASTRATSSLGTDGLCDESTKNFIARHFCDDFSNKHVWPINGKTERELRWAPFPAALGKVDTQENIADDGSLVMYLAEPERLDIDTLTWKPDGLRILDELAESDEEDLREGTFPEDNDFESLVRKRKFELDENSSSSPSSDRAPKATRAATEAERCSGAGITGGVLASQTRGQTIPGSKNANSTFTESFSAMNALNDFLNVRNGIIERPNLKSSHHFPSVISTKQPTPTLAQIPKPSSKTEPHIVPSPIVRPPTTPCPFVVSASFLSNRSLARNIQSLFPSADFIERDFNLHTLPEHPQSSPKPHTPTPLPAHHHLARQIQHLIPSAPYIERDLTLYLTSQQRPAPRPPLPLSITANEADMILSPSTGLITTTLPKIKQRALPGHAARSALRDRILSISPRYETLLVLVSEGRHADDVAGGMYQLDANDCEALVELTAFCTSLLCDVTVTFVSGGEEELAIWIVAAMVKHGVADQDGVKLLQDETLWEVFLRRAGMNAFAAQAVLGKLKKAPYGSEVDSVDFGLAAFVTMSLEERFARFETLLGGRGVLERVSGVLDACW